MASVHLPDDRLGNLPPVCVCCGALARLRVSRTFEWHPFWLHGLILVFFPAYFLLRPRLLRRKAVAVPLCEDHKHHWPKRDRTVYAIVNIASVFSLLWLTLGLHASELEEGDSPFLMVLAPASFLVIVPFVLTQRAVGARKITGTGITLVRVHPEFVKECGRGRSGGTDPLTPGFKGHWAPPRSASPPRDDIQREGGSVQEAP